MTLKIIDQLILAGAFFLAAAAVSEDIETVRFYQFLFLRIRVVNFALYLALAWCWYGIFWSLGLYHSHRFRSWQSELKDVVQAALWGTLVLLGMGTLFSMALITPTFLMFFWLAASVATLTSRLVLRYVLEELRRRGTWVENLLIIGTNQRAVHFAQKIDNRLELGCRIIGFVDDPWPGTAKFLESGYPLVADLRGFNDFLKKHVVDEVIIDLPLNTFYRQTQDIVRHCLEQGVLVRFLSDSFYLLRNMKLAQVKFDHFEGEVLLSVQHSRMAGWPIVAKRAFDLLGAFLLFLTFSPLFFLIAVLIKATSPGPVFFVQERVGQNKRLFRMYKFRTMVQGAEHRLAELEHLNEVDGPVFKIRDDPRLTPVGGWLRRTSLDELPQLINVLLGDMSLVGPRPLPVRDYQGFNQDWHRRRFSVRPGLTCLWQINGRSNLSFEEWMSLDMYYIDHWSFGLDLKILLLTFPALIREQGAY